MEFQKALNLLNSRFKYKKDSLLWDHWSVMDTSKEIWQGDCEDYSLTLLWLLVDKDKKEFKKLINDKYISFHYVRLSSGEFHFVTQIDDLYIDNIQKKLVSKPTNYRFLFRFPKWFVRLKLIL